MFSQVDLGNNTGIFHSHPGHIIQEQDGCVTIRIENKSRQEHFYAWQTGDVIEIVRIVNNLICSDIEPVVTEIQANYESTEILSQYVSMLLNLSTETPTNQSDWFYRYMTTPFPPLQLQGVERIIDALRGHVWNRMATDTEGDVAVSDESNSVWASNETAVAEIDRNMMSRTRMLGEHIRRSRSVDMPDSIPTAYQAVTDGHIPIGMVAQLALEAIRGENESNSSPRGGGDEPVSGGRLPEHEANDDHYEAQEEHEMLDAKLQPQEENEDEEKPDYSDTSEVDDLIATMKSLISEEGGDS